jgi:hypothetical protein
VSATSVGSAESFHISAFQCIQQQPGLRTSDTEGWKGTGGWGQLMCAVPDMASEKKQNHTALDVYAERWLSSNQQLSAFACTTTSLVPGGICGTAAHVNAPGNYTLKPSRSAWNASRAYDFGYLKVWLDTYDAVRGYYIAN